MLRAAAATGVPRLSVQAKAAIGAIAAAQDRASRAGAWEALRADAEVAGEIARFTAAVEARFGSDGLRALDRTGTLASAAIAPAERGALAKISRTVQVVREGECAAAVQAQRVAATQRAGQGARLRP